MYIIRFVYSALDVIILCQYLIQFQAKKKHSTMPDKILSYTYLLLAIAGAVIPWYFNYSHIQYGEIPISFQAFWQSGFHDYLSSSLTADLLVGATTFAIWMFPEGRRLGMKRLWIYFLVIFMVAFACAFPLFLFFRQRHLMKKKG